VKIAVSIPDELFDRAERAARDTGMSRSGLYAEALRQFLRTLPDAEIEARLNAVYSNDPGSLDPETEALVYSGLSDDDWPPDVREP
jgi:metal-responsive CopG/Arc/MetJ family transcriptional regulator